jgi:membrane protein implicated in regulation of membrane protease activity
MRVSRPLRTVLTLILTWLLALPLSACSFLLDAEYASFRMRSYGEPALAARAKTPKNQYAAVRGKKTMPGFAFAQAPLDLWGPFDAGVTFGLFNEKLASGATNAFGCLELSNRPGTTTAAAGDPRGAPFSIFYDICARFVVGGILLFAQSHLGALGTATMLPGATAADVRAEYDGLGNLNLYGRALGQVAWIPIAIVLIGVLTAPLLFNVGVANLLRGGEVGIDNPTLTRGLSLLPLVGALLAAQFLGTAMIHLMAACLALDGAAYNPVQAATLLGLALLAVLAAQSESEQLSSASARAKSPGQQALGKIAKARKQIEKAIAKVEAGKAPAAARKVGKALKAAGEATLLLQPQSVSG